MNEGSKWTICIVLFILALQFEEGTSRGGRGGRGGRYRYSRRGGSVDAGPLTGEQIALFVGIIVGILAFFGIWILIFCLCGSCSTKPLSNSPAVNNRRTRITRDNTAADCNGMQTQSLAQADRPDSDSPNTAPPPYYSEVVRAPPPSYSEAVPVVFNVTEEMKSRRYMYRENLHVRCESLGILDIESPLH